MVQIKRGPYAKKGDYLPGRVKPIEFIVLHFTANNGDTDEGNANFFSNTDIDASAGYFVDEDSITQSVRDADTAYHCGGLHYVHPRCRNTNSLGIEMCSDKVNGVYVITKETVDRTRELVKEKMKEFKVPIENVLRHFDVTGKPCPEPWVRIPQLWIDFKNSLIEEEEEMTQQQFKQMYDNMIAEKHGNAPSEYAKNSCIKAQNKKIFNGDGQGNFDWQEPISKEQVCVILDKMGLLG